MHNDKVHFLGAVSEKRGKSIVLLYDNLGKL